MAENRYLRPVPVVIVLLVMMGVSTWGCGGKDDTQAIREMIQKGAGLAEEKKIGDLLDLTTTGFTAHPGSHDRKQTKRMLFAAFMHYGKFKIHYPRPTVEIASDGRRALTTVHFLIVRQNQDIPGLKELYDDPGQWIESAREKADLYQLRLALVKEGGDWLVGQAEMEGFKGLSF